MDKIKLKPCPFCGSNLIGIKKSSAQYRVIDTYADNSESYMTMSDEYNVFCDKCSCKTAAYFYIDVAIESWNRRASDG